MADPDPMHRLRNLLLTSAAGGLLLACGAQGGDSADGSADEPGLVERAIAMLPSSSGEDAGSSSAAGGSATAETGPKEAIVRCEVNGTVTYRRQSRCDNLGGQAVKMAIRSKNDR